MHEHVEVPVKKYPASQVKQFDDNDPVQVVHLESHGAQY